MRNAGSMPLGLASLALAVAIALALVAVRERTARSPAALLQGGEESLWTPRGYGAGRPQGFGEPYPAWYPGMYPIPPTQEAAALAYAPEFVPYLRYKDYLQHVLDAKLDAKRAERDKLASEAYQEAAGAARDRQAWLDDYEAQKAIRQREAWEKHLAGPAPEWKAPGGQALSGGVKKQVKKQQLFSVQDLMDAGDSEAEAMMDPKHPDGPWGKWVDGPRPDGDDFAAPGRAIALVTNKLHARPHAKHPMPAHGKFPSPAARPGGKGLPSASQVFHQSLAAVDLGAESNSEALMDPSHPSGPWGTWVEPSTSARAVIGEKQYEAYVGDTGFRAAMANVQDADEAKAVKQSLAGVDLGSESYAEALMDPSHPSGPWGTWVEPPTSARSVIGEKQYEADTTGLFGGARNSRRQMEAGEAAIAAAVAKSDHTGFGVPGAAATGLGGRYGGPHGAAQADSAESYVFGRLLDTSSA